MLHLYDSCPYSLQAQQIRLKSACVLSKARIKSLVWGDDALAFIHFVPANLNTLHLVVADKDVCLASTEIIKSLPYEVFTGIDKNYVEYIWFDPDQSKAFPNSTHLQLTTPINERSVDDPDIIFIHPQSQFYLDIDNISRSLSLPPFPDNIQFPTRTAFLDSITTILDPPSGRVNTKLRGMLRVWLSYFFVYTLRNRPSVLPTGELEQEHAEVLQSLSPENRPFFEAYTRDGSSDPREHAIRRKEILENLGCASFLFPQQLERSHIADRRYEEARRPLPLPIPGNPALRRVLFEI